MAHVDGHFGDAFRVIAHTFELVGDEHHTDDAAEVRSEWRLASDLLYAFVLDLRLEVINTVILFDDLPREFQVAVA